MNRSVAITGIGLLSGLGENADAHWEGLSRGAPQPVVDETRFAPYPVHPLGPVDFSTQVPKKGDLRQMEPWQRIGTFTAGLALADAGIAGNLEYLERTDMIVAAGSGERDTATDMKVLETISHTDRDHGDVCPNEILPSNLRPTLFLAQLSNLLAGNISIVHKVTGSSRTFMGEEMAGVAAISTATKRIKAGQGDLFLVGGAFNAEREDMLLNFELGGMLAQGPHSSVWERAAGTKASGLAPASIGAFLVLEELSHAEKRGANVYAIIEDVVSGRCNRKPQSATENARRLLAAMDADLKSEPFAILSGASGAEPATSDELDFLKDVIEQGTGAAIRGYGTVLGHAVEAHFPVGVALAALALRNDKFYPPFDQTGIEKELANCPDQILVSCWGHWRGEAFALVRKAGN